MSHHPSWLCRQAALAVCAAGAFVSYSYCTIAATNEDIGRAPLADKLGAALPTGVGVPVMQVEAVFEGGTLMELDPEFLGKTLTMRTPIAAAGWHALNVGKIFYGLNSSIAPGITQIELYDTNGLNGFMGPGLLNAGAGTNPLVSSQHSRVANHSWVGRTMEPLDVLERVDWLVERDDMVHVVAVHNISGLINPLLSNSMNSISVGVSNGNHETVALSLGGIYTANRTRPEIVAPAGATSFAAPMISAAAATLIGVGHSQPALSQNQFYKSPRTGEIIYHAETSEVIKAALLAGASRQAFNSDGSIIYGYRGAASTESDNGLDTRYGAGQVNLQNSYFILAAGEQKSLQDGGRALNSADGFHYDANFGGANGSNSTATYDFVAGWTGQTLTA
ncbi:MAG: S8 family serine peptidase, partial [Planctomycetota bacterium]|nr:S8 family serine peptidase [Planctomycetota bacterium]